MPAQHFAESLEELVDRFGAVSAESQTITGSWRSEGVAYRDKLTRIFVEVPDTEASVAFFSEWKAQLKRRFAQLEIWITSHPVEVL